ncbi:MAG: hypothetical protein NW200_02115 [Hyphomonadaceae bacterium]|nr:hypothetical protein [Hyphomonadaceae bacterium]
MSYPAIEAPSAEARTTDAPYAAASGPFMAFRIQTLLAIFLQRIGFNQTIGGVLYPLPVSLIGTPLVLGWLVWRGWARPSPARIGLYCIMVVGACFSLLLAKSEVSSMSMYMYLILYGMFLFPVVLEDDAYERYYRMILKVAVAVCLIGVAQYAIQYVWHPKWLFTWRDFIAPEFLIEFNTLNWTSWGSGIYKANGFFLMEASWLSQLAARALLIAVILLRDPRYLIPCGAAMLATYSGTGITLFVLFGAIPLMILYLRSPRLLPWAVLGAVAIPLVMMVFYRQLNLELFITRLNEFESVNSSAYFRFVLSQQIFERFQAEPFLTLVFGSGPGTADTYLAGYVNDGFIPGWLKLSVDYGFVGFMAFSAFLVTCVYQTTQSRIIAAAVLFQYLWLDSSLVVPQAAFVTLLMMCAVVRRSTFRPFGAPAA